MASLRIKSVDLDFSRFAIALFLISNIGFYYSEYIILANFSQLILIAAGGLSLSKSWVVGGKDFIVMAGTFLVFALASSIWSVQPDMTLENVNFLFKSVMLAIAFVLVCHDGEKGRLAIKYFAHGGLIFGAIYISKVGVLGLGFARAIVEDQAGMPNINVVSLLVGTSFIFYLFEYYCNKSRFALILFIVSFFIVVLLGSRKSILISLLGGALLWFGVGARQKISSMSLFSAAVVGAIIFAPDGFFDFAFERFGTMLSVFEGGGDESDNIRWNLLVRGLGFIADAPIFGHGYAVFPFLYGRETGLYVSPHNNYLEVVTGLGILGLTLYMAIFYRIFRGVMRNCAEKHKRLILIMLVSFLLNGFLIAFTGERYAWVFLAIMYSFSIGYSSEVSRR